VFTLRNAVLQLLKGSLIGRSLSLVLNLLLSRVLGPAGLGVFGFFTTTTQTLEIASRLGVDYSVTCELTDENHIFGKLDKEIIIKSALHIVGVASVLLSIVAAGWISTGSNGITLLDQNSRISSVILLVLCSILEGYCGIRWDILLALGRSDWYSIRQFIFAPLRLACAAGGAIIGGILGGLIGYTLSILLQSIWISYKLRSCMKIKSDIRVRKGVAVRLLRGGLGLYAANSLAAIVFLPLMAWLGVQSGIDKIGYVKAGQIVVQLFTLVPGAIAPLLFIKLMEKKNSHGSRNEHLQNAIVLIWWTGLLSLVIYLLVDKQLVRVLFGDLYLPSVTPTRILILAAICESVGQVLHSPLLAEKRIRLFSLTQNGSVLAAAALGYYLIGIDGLFGYLVARLTHAGLPVVVYLINGWKDLECKRRVVLFSGLTILLIPSCLIEGFPDNFTIPICFLVIVTLLVESQEIRSMAFRES
jgi:O-antigen/teichoic acid export membrane protein